MLTAVRCVNFRCFPDTGTLVLAPLTILVGENNSGKSSIIQALHLPGLTLQSEDPGTCLRLLHQDYDYGSFEDIALCHDSRQSITLSFEVRLPAADHEMLPEVGRAQLELTYGYLPMRKEIYLSRWVLADELGPRWTIEQGRYRRSKKVRVRGSDAASAYWAKSLLQDRFLFRQSVDFWDLHRRARRTLGVKDGDQLLREMWAGQALLRVFERSFRQVQHIGPIRVAPSRTYLHSGEMAHRVGPRGELALRIYAALQQRHTNEDLKILRAIHQSLYKLGFIREFRSRGVGPRHYEFWTEHDESGFQANLADTGFGASQVLPVIVSLFAADRGSTLLLEQPEIHLHPAAQAELGSVIADAVSDEKRIVMETHSQNLILRLQTEVARGRLRAEDVALYYVLPERMGHRVVRIPVDAKGRFLREWPRGFFEEGYLESIKLFQAREGGE